MKPEEMITNYQNTLLRIDTYINSINTKGAFIVAFNTFIIGGVLSNYSKIVDSTNCICLVKISIVALTSLAILSTFFVGLAVFPFLKSGNIKEGYQSNIFFGSIAKFKEAKEYLDATQNYGEEKYVEDLKRQIHVLSQGLAKKFSLIGYSMYLFFACLILSAVLIFSII